MAKSSATHNFVEAGINILFSIEKMALSKSVRPRAGARAFAQGLFDFLGPGHRSSGSLPV